MNVLVSPEYLALVATGLAAGSGLPAVLSRGRGGRVASAALLGLASLAGCAAAVFAFLGHGAPLELPWALADDRLLVRVDALSAVFLIAIYTVPTLGAVFGVDYFDDREHPTAARAVPLFYGLTSAGMGLLTVAGHSLLFLVGWEVMALAAFFCLSVDHREEEVRRSGYVYLAATHLGTLCLFGAFALLAVLAGSFAFPGAGGLATGPTASAAFLLALVGFGVKAGLVPVHAWLPGAHAGAPSHVSAMMSGVLIKTGVYGIVRFASFFGDPPLWWGILVVAIGLVSAVLGVVWAMGQHDLKRLLAYHSVENIGIIVTGLGVALVGRTLGRPELLALGLAGALLHVWNHAAFKGLLFLGAGAVIHGSGTREIDRLGGLAKRMPRTAFWFLVGAVAICGLPPLNGFVSELFLYMAALDAAAVPTAPGLAVILVAPGLATVGALAVACFTKAYGAVFLGLPRTEHATAGHEPGATMRLPLAALGVACIAIGLAGPLLAFPLDRAIHAFAGTALPPVAGLAPLGAVSLGGLAIYAVVGLLALYLVHRSRGAGVTGTWDCGYAAPSARMQYTASSFAAFPLSLFSRAAAPHRVASLPEGPFPRPGRFESHLPEPVLERFVGPLVQRVLRVFGSLRWVQQGQLQVYLAYLGLALVAVLLWAAVGGGR